MPTQLPPLLPIQTAQNTESKQSLLQHHACGAEEQLVASALMRTKSAYALEQKEHRGEILPGGTAALLELLDRDISTGRFNLFPAGEDILHEAVAIAATCYRATASILLRTLDGIHLATAQLLKCTRIATTDDRTRTAAEVIKMPLLQASDNLTSEMTPLFGWCSSVVDSRQSRSDL